MEPKELVFFSARVFFWRLISGCCFGLWQPLDFKACKVLCCGDVAESFSSLEPMGWIMNWDRCGLAINDCFVERCRSCWKLFSGFFLSTSVVGVCVVIIVQCCVLGDLGKSRGTMAVILTVEVHGISIFICWFIFFCTIVVGGHFGKVILDMIGAVRRSEVAIAVGSYFHGKVEERQCHLCVTDFGTFGEVVDASGKHVLDISFGSSRVRCLAWELGDVSLGIFKSFES